MKVIWVSKKIPPNTKQKSYPPTAKGPFPAHTAESPCTCMVLSSSLHFQRGKTFFYATMLCERGMRDAFACPSMQDIYLLPHLTHILLQEAHLRATYIPYLAPLLQKAHLLPNLAKLLQEAHPASHHAHLILQEVYILLQEVAHLSNLLIFTLPFDKNRFETSLAASPLT